MGPQLSELEALLLVSGAVDPPENDVWGRDQSEQKRDASDSEDDDDDEPSSRMRSAATSTNARREKNIRSSKPVKDDDSDFEFDM